MALTPKQTMQLTSPEREFVDALEPLIDERLNAEYDPAKDIHPDAPLEVSFSFNQNVMIGKQTLWGKKLSRAQYLEVCRRYSKWNVTEHSSREGYWLVFTARRGPDWQPPTPEPEKPLPQLVAADQRTLTSQVAAKQLPRVVIYYAEDGDSQAFGEHLVATLNSLGVNAVSVESLLQTGEKKSILRERITADDYVVMVASEQMNMDANAAIVYETVDEYCFQDRRSRLLVLKIDSAYDVARWWVFSQLRQYWAGDFTAWHEASAFTKGVTRLVRDLTSLNE